MDFNSIKEVAVTSLNSYILLFLVPTISILIMTLLELDRGSINALLGKGYLEPSKLGWVVMNLITLILISAFLTPKFLINDDIKVLVPIKLSQTEYTDRVMNKITNYYKTGQYKNDGRYIKIDNRGNMEFIIIEDRKIYEGFRTKDSKQNYIQDQYKKELYNIIKSVILEESRDKNSYQNLTEKEKREAIELYNKWKENKNTKTKFNKAQKDADVSKILNYTVTVQHMTDNRNN